MRKKKRECKAGGASFKIFNTSSHCELFRRFFTRRDVTYCYAVIGDGGDMAARIKRQLELRTLSKNKLNDKKAKNNNKKSQKAKNIF